MTRILIAAALCLVSLPSFSAVSAQSISIVRDSVNPQWTEDGQRFWFESKAGHGQREFWLVDAVQGTRQPLFDHQQLAAEIENKTGTASEPNKLPGRFAGYDPQTETITWKFAGTEIFIDRSSGKIEWADATIDKDSLNQAAANDVSLFLPAVPSENGGDTVSFAVTNKLDYEVEVLWVNTQRQFIPYAKLAPSETFSTRSFAGHVWFFRGSDQKDLGCLKLNDNPATNLELNPSVISEASSTPSPNRPNREGRRSGRGGGRGSSNFSPGSTSPSRSHSVEVRDHDLWMFSPNDRDNAVQLTSDGSEKSSFRQSAQRARLVSMQYDRTDFPEQMPEVVWSRDSKYLLAWQTSVVPERRVYMVQSLGRDGQPELQSYPYAKPGDELPQKTLRLFDVEAQTEIPISNAAFHDPWTLDIERFSPDSKHVWLKYNQRGHQKIQVVRIELATGEATVIIDENSPTFLHYSDGAKYNLRWLDDSTALWGSERSGWHHLYHIDMMTGEVLNATTEGEWNVKRIEAIRDGVIWFYAVGLAQDQDPYHEHFCRVNIDGSHFVPLTDGDGMHSITWSPTEEYFVDLYSRVDLPPVHELRRSSDGALICEIERAEMVGSQDTTRLGTLPVRFSAPGRDGKTPIWGVVHFPANFDPNKSWPVIESIYAGPHNYHVPKRFGNSRSFSRFTSAGFVVVQIDGMGTAWRSKAFHDVCYRNLRDAGFPDRIAWMKALAEVYPSLDLNRVGIFGGSAGGQNAMAALLWHNDFYKVAVADCGCHDNRMDKVWWNEQWMGTVSPGNHYAENSNMENAHLLKGKLLLVVGELDRNVDPASTTQVAARLVQADKDYELLMIPGAGHGACETPYGQRRRLDFFKQHLLEP